MDVLLEDTTAGTRYHWVKTSDVQVGRADATAAVPPGGGGDVAQIDEHTRELGHCLQNIGVGTDVLRHVLLCFN